MKPSPSGHHLANSATIQLNLQHSSYVVRGAQSHDHMHMISNGSSKRGYVEELSPRPEAEERENASESAELYKVWPGKNKFFCGGRVMTGPDVGTAIASFFLFTIPFALFVAIPARELLDPLGPWPIIVSSVLYVSTAVALFVASTSDPGILPRNPQKLSANPDAKIETKPPRVQKFVMNGREYEMKYCETCNIYRPPRSLHCSICDNCVEVFDHHCPWIGNCVGKANYRSFSVFVYSVNSLAVFVAALSIYWMLWASDEYDSFGGAMSHNPVPLIITVFALIAELLVGALCIFHISLAWRGITTNEQIKSSFPLGSPFSRGCFRNFVDLFFTFPKRVKWNRYKQVNPDSLHGPDDPISNVTFIKRDLKTREMAQLQQYLPAVAKTAAERSHTPTDIVYLAEDNPPHYEHSVSFVPDRSSVSSSAGHGGVLLPRQEPESASYNADARSSGRSTSSGKREASGSPGPARGKAMLSVPEEDTRGHVGQSASLQDLSRGAASGKTKGQISSSKTEMTLASDGDKRLKYTHSSPRLDPAAIAVVVAEEQRRAASSKSAAAASNSTGPRVSTDMSSDVSGPTLSPMAAEPHTRGKSSASLDVRIQVAAEPNTPSDTGSEKEVAAPSRRGTRRAARQAAASAETGARPSANSGGTVASPSASRAPLLPATPSDGRNGSSKDKPSDNSSSSSGANAGRALKGKGQVDLDQYNW